MTGCEQSDGGRREPKAQGMSTEEQSTTEGGARRRRAKGTDAEVYPRHVWSPGADLEKKIGNQYSSASSQALIA